MRDDADLRLCLIFCAGVAAAVFAFGAAVGITIDHSSFAILYALNAIFLLAACYGHFRDMRRLKHGLVASALMLFCTVPVLNSTYIAMGWGLPVADAKLIAMDARIGFFWPDFVAAVDRMPVLAGALSVGYQSFSIQLLSIPLVLALCGHIRRAYQTVVGYVVLCMASSTLSTFYPSLGAYVAYGVAQADLDAVNAHFGFFFLNEFHSVREGLPFVINAESAAGIITFPSVHAAVACLCAWALYPVRALRYPAIVLNALMFVSAITHGAHYAVDIIAGALVAAVSIAAASAMFERSVKGFPAAVPTGGEPRTVPASADAAAAVSPPPSP